MKNMHFVDVYRQVDTSLPLMCAWLYDTDNGWALRIPVSREDSAEYLLLKSEDNVSIYDAVSPSTLPFIAQFMSAVQVKAISVEIRALFERAFYGAATFQQADETFEVTGRVGLLVALALRFSCPIVIDEELLARTGMRLPPHTTIHQWLAEEQANVYQRVSLPPPHVPLSAHLEAFMRQAPGKPLTSEQQQQVQAEIQQGLGPDQLKQLRHFYTNLSPEARKVSKEMWGRLGFSAPPLPEGIVEDDNGIDSK